MCKTSPWHNLQQLLTRSSPALSHGGGVIAASSHLSFDGPFGVARGSKMNSLNLRTNLRNAGDQLARPIFL